MCNFVKNIMKFGVVVFPGSNCDKDMIYVIESVLGHQVVELWYKDTDLNGVDLLCFQEAFRMVIT